MFTGSPSARIFRSTGSATLTQTTLAVSGDSVLASGQVGTPVPLQRLGADNLESVADAPAFTLLAGAGGSRLYGAADNLQRREDGGAAGSWWVMPPRS